MQGTKEEGGVKSYSLTDAAIHLLFFLYSSSGVAGLNFHLSGRRISQSSSSKGGI